MADSIIPKNASVWLFDLDGTLIDSVPDLAAAVDHMLGVLGYGQAGEDEVRNWVGNGAVKLVQRALAFSHRLTESQIDTQHDDFAKIYRLFECAYDARLTQATGVYSGVIEVLSRLQQSGKQLGLITNKPRRFTEPLLQSLGLSEYFSLLICGDDLAEKKPHPLPVETVLSTFNVQAHEAVMIGDSISDIASAQAAGVATIAVTYGYNHGTPIAEAEVKAEHYIDSMQELLLSL